MATPSDINLYTSHTPNGIKISILLEELGLAYKVTKIELDKDVQKEPWFLEINPNGRIPAITDVHSDGEPIRIFESGSILQYLVDKYDPQHKVSYPSGSREYYETNSWLFWQVGGLGPMQGQANHFVRYTFDKIQYGIDRYQNETRRLYRVLDTQLAKSSSGFLVGDRITIADISSWSWVSSHSWAGLTLDEFPHLAAWVAELRTRPGFERGRRVGANENKVQRKNLTLEEIEREQATAAAENRAWVQRGMAQDAKK
ncbi:glutathione S-transferase [Thozetella sp. PMI_491]|nr:glutathione S-transferase [Thozetella sp. PMI_491]